MNRPRMFMALVTLALATGCAHKGRQSWVDVSTAKEESVQLADEIVAIVKNERPPASGTLTLIDAKQTNNPLTPALERALQKAGYALARGATRSDAVPVEYRVEPVADGLVLTLRIGKQTEATRWYRRQGTGLVTYSPVAVGRRG